MWWSSKSGARRLGGMSQEVKAASMSRRYLSDLSVVPIFCLILAAYVATKQIIRWTERECREAKEILLPYIIHAVETISPIRNRTRTLILRAVFPLQCHHQTQRHRHLAEGLEYPNLPLRLSPAHD
ncbi:hypothetical protein CCHR01_11552 [Colletotrichum chrysophilum]|uniref:Uncharacterized protein n=1 Tax=Colletotrichum chrysophilum TaxID=1836956 RepID=A0AAD9EEM1_9PEZI|nr:hypothetical protein CCHR01_11552 [Colletotrichum chrysophilum]